MEIKENEPSDLAAVDKLISNVMTSKSLPDLDPQPVAEEDNTTVFLQTLVKDESMPEVEARKGKATEANPKGITVFAYLLSFS